MGWDGEWPDTLQPVMEPRLTGYAVDAILRASYVRSAVICGGVIVMNGRVLLIKSMAASALMPSAMK